MNDRTKGRPTRRRNAVRAASVAKRRADLSGTAPWAFRVPRAQPPAVRTDLRAKFQNER